MIEALFLLPGARPLDPAVRAGFDRADPLCALVEPWFDALRGCGDDVSEILHDGNPTACVDDAAFAYVAAFSTHAAIGFFQGAFLPDPQGLLEGSGKRMRHVKLRWDRQPDAAVLQALVTAAYHDVKRRLAGQANAPA